MSNIFDTHCHPQFSHYDRDREEVIQRGVPMLCVGTDLEMSKKAIELARSYSGVWASVGLHPNDTDDFIMDDFIHLMNEEKVVAVGEVGLDYYRTTQKERQKKQREVFKQFIDLASQYKKPLILHCRDAHEDALKILKSADNILYGGVAHSFTGTVDEAKKYLDLGFYLGFNGIITFADQYDEVVRHVPIDRILLETDAPYLTPEPYRGKRNEPMYVKEVAQKISELKCINLNKVVEQTTQNTIKLFNISL